MGKPSREGVFGQDLPQRMSKILIHKSRMYSILDRSVSRQIKQQELHILNTFSGLVMNYVLTIRLSSQLSHKARTISDLRARKQRGRTFNVWQRQFSNPGPLDPEAGALATRADLFPQHVLQRPGDWTRFELTDCDKG